MKKLQYLLIVVSKNIWIKWGVIPLFLFLFWLFFSEVFSPLSSFSVVVYNHHRENFTTYHKGELLKGQKVDGEFVAQENNLGIVAVRFHTYERINSDSLIFRIKQKGSPTWYYQNLYKVNQFQPEKLFTFGLPVISDSKGKVYDIELESTKGKRNDAVAISTQEPVFVSKYSFSKSIIIHNPKQFFRLMYLKTTNLLSDYEFYPNSFLFLLPLLFYILLRSKFPRPGWERIVYSCLFGLAILCDVLFVEDANFLVISGMIGLWIVMINVYLFDSSISFIAAFVSLLFVPLMLLINREHYGEQFGLLTYSFLLIGIAQLFYENKKRQNTIGYKTIVSALKRYEKK